MTALVRVRHRPDVFEATEIERTAYGIEAVGQWRKPTASGHHRYPPAPTRLTLPWGSIVEVREEVDR